MTAADNLPARPVVSARAEALYMRMVSTGGQPGEGDEADIRELLNLGLLRAAADGFIPVDPGSVGSRWTAEFHSAAAQMLEHAARVSDALSNLTHAYDNRAVPGLIEYLRGSDTINARLGQVLGACTDELLFCQPGGVRRQAVLDETSERDLAALGRGVEMKTIYHEYARAGENMTPWVELVTAAGAQIRTLADPFQRMFIIDRRIAVIPGNDVLKTSQDAVAYMIHDPGVAGFLAAQFMDSWNRAEPWGRGAPRCALTVREEAILRMLAAGESHRTIERHFGMGERTLAKAIAKLKAHFDGATTLFELACRWKDSTTS